MKIYLRELKTTLLYKNLINNYHFIVILLVLTGLMYYHQNAVILLILIIYVIYLFIKNRYLAIFSIMLFCFFIMGLIINELEFKNAILGEKWAYIKVLEAEETKNTHKLIVKTNQQKYLIYSKEKYEIGDILYINGYFERIEESHIPSLFNYQEYSKYHNIVGKITLKEVVYLLI